MTTYTFNSKLVTDMVVPGNSFVHKGLHRNSTIFAVTLTNSRVASKNWNIQPERRQNWILWHLLHKDSADRQEFSYICFSTLWLLEKDAILECLFNLVSLYITAPKLTSVCFDINVWFLSLAELPLKKIGRWLKTMRKKLCNLRAGNGIHCVRRT